jgi:CRISPR-associated endonuclease Cas3-HD
MGSGLKTCYEYYIAGCNVEYRGRCYESMEDHIGKMLEVYRTHLNMVGLTVRNAYNNYIKDLEMLLSKRGIKTLDLGDATEIIECDPVELSIALHDVGKCTQRNQDSLRERCTAPHHEAISAAYLINLAISLDSQWGPLLALPHAIAILLHHHPMRSIEEVLSKAHTIRVDEKDVACVSKCASEALKKTCSKLASNIIADRLIDEIPNLLFIINYMFRRSETAEIAIPAYGVALRITGVLSILDRYSAGINRSCGVVSEKDLDRSIVEYLRRKRAFVEASRILRDLGI